MADSCKTYEITETKRITTKQQLENLVYIVDTLMDCGLNGMTYNVAFAIAGNISGESGFDPHDEHVNSKAYGLCQWYDTRKTNLIDFCRDIGLSYTEREGQIKFLIHELKNGYKKVYNKIINMNENIDDMAYTFCMEFEVPGEKYCQQRPGMARECARKYKEVKNET